MPILVKPCLILSDFHIAGKLELVHQKVNACITQLSKDTLPSLGSLSSMAFRTIWLGILHPRAKSKILVNYLCRTLCPIRICMFQWHASQFASPYRGWLFWWGLRSTSISRCRSWVSPIGGTLWVLLWYVDGDLSLEIALSLEYFLCGGWFSSVHCLCAFSEIGRALSQAYSLNRSKLIWRIGSSPSYQSSTFRWAGLVGLWYLVMSATLPWCCIGYYESCHLEYVSSTVLCNNIPSQK